MSTRLRKSRTTPAIADVIAALRCEHEAAENEQTRQLIAAIAPDRVALRPAVAVAAVSAGKTAIVVRAGDLFVAAGSAGQADFVAIRDEVVPAVEILESGPVTDARMVPAGWAGYRLVLNKPREESWPLRLRVHIAEAASASANFSALMLGGVCVARPHGGAWRKIEMKPAAVETADGAFPTPALGCRGRSLLTAWFHAPHAFAFFDVVGLADDANAAESLELMLLVRDEATFTQLPSDAFRVGCLPLTNRRADTVHVTLEAKSSFAPLPVPAGQAVAGIGRVQLFRGEGEWAECRPWLGSRYPWRHKSPVSGRYVLSRARGTTPPAIGLVDPGADLSTADAHHLHAELFLADTQAHALIGGTPLIGPRKLHAELVGAPTPLLIPTEIDPAELNAETTAAGWLARTRDGDATERLRAVLECAAGGLATVRGGRPAGMTSALAQIDGLRRATIRSGPTLNDFPGTLVEVELDAGRFPGRAPYLFGTVLERALGYFARPLTYTQLTVRTEGGEVSWLPRWPVG